MGLCSPSYFLFSIQHFLSGRIEEKEKSRSWQWPGLHRGTASYSCIISLACFAFFLSNLEGRREKERVFICSSCPTFPLLQIKNQQQPTPLSSDEIPAAHFCRLSFPRNTGNSTSPTPCTKRSFTCTDRSLPFQLRPLQIANSKGKKPWVVLFLVLVIPFKVKLPISCNLHE